MVSKHDVATVARMRCASSRKPKSIHEAVQELMADEVITGAHMHICHVGNGTR